MPLPNACPKPRPRLLDRRKAKAAIDKQDREERAKCHERSGGGCEVIVNVTPNGKFISRCWRRATQNHHLIGGIGRRNRGKSILAKHRLDVCARCHQEIGATVLVPIDGTKKEAAATVRYERRK